MTTDRSVKFIAMALIILAGVCALETEVWAADSFEFTRHTYDLIMRYVNFLILAGVIIKYARRPIASFLKDKRGEVRQAIEDLEQQKRNIEKQIESTQEELRSGQALLTLVKEKIIAEGRQRKEELISEAKTDSALLLDNTRHKIDAIIRDASSRIRSDLIDMAADLALEKLPRLVTVEDHDRLIQEWIETTQVSS